MPITIKKVVRPTVPEPLVNPRAPEPPPTAPTPPPRPEQAPTKYSERPLAKSAADFRRDPNAYRSPPRVACTFCGHGYSFPCNGTDPKCMNAKWVRDMQAKEGKK